MVCVLPECKIPYVQMYIIIKIGNITQTYIHTGLLLFFFSTDYGKVKYAILINIYGNLK